MSEGVGVKLFTMTLWCTVFGSWKYLHVTSRIYSFPVSESYKLDRPYVHATTYLLLALHRSQTTVHSGYLGPWTGDGVRCACSRSSRLQGGGVSRLQL